MFFKHVITLYQEADRPSFTTYNFVQCSKFQNEVAADIFIIYFVIRDIGRNTVVVKNIRTID